MIKAIESEIYRISKSDNHDDVAYIIEIKETETSIVVFKEEISELVIMLNKAREIL